MRFRKAAIISQCGVEHGGDIEDSAVPIADEILIRPVHQTACGAWIADQIIGTRGIQSSDDVAGDVSAALEIARHNAAKDSR